MLPGRPESAGCVRGLRDSPNSAIRTTYRVSPRSSSAWEPRYPSSKVVDWVILVSRKDRPAIPPSIDVSPRGLRFFFLESPRDFLVRRPVRIFDVPGRDLYRSPSGVGASLPRPGGKGRRRPMDKVLQMIHPQVHLRIPCYDFSFL